MAEYAFPGSYLAYPHKGPSTGVIIHEPGMTLRDWFAGQAFSGLISKGSEKISYGFYDDAAYFAYRAADAMMEARNK